MVVGSMDVYIKRICYKNYYGVQMLRAITILWHKITLKYLFCQLEIYSNEITADFIIQKT